jgi:hypothetical protein
VRYARRESSSPASCSNYRMLEPWPTPMRWTPNSTSRPKASPHVAKRSPTTFQAAPVRANDPADTSPSIPGRGPRRRSPRNLTRAVNYLYTKETKSSFAIEHEVATGQRAERFVGALQLAPSRLTRRASSPCRTSLLIRATLPRVPRLPKLHRRNSRYPSGEHHGRFQAAASAMLIGLRQFHGRSSARR